MSISPFDVWDTIWVLIWPVPEVYLLILFDKILFTALNVLVVVQSIVHINILAASNIHFQFVRMF